MNDEEKQRILAVRRFFAGEKPEAICSSLGRSRPWLYKWVGRHSGSGDAWFTSLSKSPACVANRTPAEIESIVKLVRLNLYNQDLFCGAQAILWELEDLGVSPLPSLRTINRILERNDLTHRRTGKYEPKGTPYPKLPALLPNQTHQMDLVGPCYLSGPIRFYGLNAIDTATSRPHFPSPEKTFWPEPGPSGYDWEYRTISRSITPCLSWAVRGIREQ